MATFSPEIWALLALLSLGGVTAVLHVLARYLRAERELHDLRLQVQEVRGNYAKRLAQMAANGEVSDVEVIEVEPIDNQPDLDGAISPAARAA